jgi:uncharacterized protein (TIGR02145 family)
LGNANEGAITGWSAANNATDGSWNSGTEAAPVKVSANDPCPAGYRVPTLTEWTAVNTNNNVSRTGTFTVGTTQYDSALHYGSVASPKLLTLPAAGYRYFANGELYPRGDVGAYWSSAEAGSNAYTLYFDSGVVDAANVDGNRTYGFSLRCIAE